MRIYATVAMCLRWGPPPHTHTHTHLPCLCGAEFWGTLLFQMFGGSAPNKDTSAPAANGFALVAAIYAFCNISGGHLNPAVTFALMCTGVECGKGQADGLQLGTAEIGGSAVLRTRVDWW